MTRRLWLAFTFLICSGRLAFSQDVAGQTFVASPADSMTLTTAQPTMKYARHDLVGTSEVATRDSKSTTRWLTGLVIGGGVLGLWAARTRASRSCGALCGAGSVTAGLMLGGMTASIIDAEIAVAKAGHHWKPTSSVGRSRAELAPVVGRNTGVQLRVAF
jgi:hypothetical protein